MESVRPGMPVMELSARTGAGVAAWIDELERRRGEKRSPAAAAAIPESRVASSEP